MSNRPDTELNSMTDNFVKTIKYIVTKVLLKSVKTVLQNRKCIHFMSQQQQFKPYMGMLWMITDTVFICPHYDTK